MCCYSHQFLNFEHRNGFEFLHCSGILVKRWLHVSDTSDTLPNWWLDCLERPVYTGMPLEYHWLTQYTPEYHWATQRILAGYTGTPLEKLSWNSPTLECHWRNSYFCSLHWNTTGETVTAHTRPHTCSKACEWCSCQFEMTRCRDSSKQVDRSLYIQPSLGVYCCAMDASSALNPCEYFNITLCMPLIWAPF